MKAKITLAVCISVLAVVSLEVLRLRFVAKSGEAKSGEVKAQKAKEMESAEAGIKALRALETATGVGVNLSDYRSRLIETKITVSDALSHIPSVPEEVFQIRAQIELAMYDYGNALTAWEVLRERYNSEPFVPAQDTMLEILLPAYPDIKTHTVGGKTYYYKSDILPGIWKSASTHTDQGLKLLHP